MKGEINMIKIKCLVVVALSFLFINGMAYATEEDLNGRYTIYVVEIDKKPEPFLLDTQTGKIWSYGSADGFGKEKMFKGLSVEGLAYSSKDKEDIEQQLSEWGTKQLIDVDVKGYKDCMLNEFSYSLDLKRAQVLNKKMKYLARQKDE